MNKKALIAMSGGVDSSVAAFLMQERGFSCVGATMRLYTNDDIVTCEKTCCSLDDVEDARSVAARLGMEYHVFNFADRFKKDVIDRFVSTYEGGATPNPCIDCNSFLKFDKLFERAEILGCDCIATGHYARVDCDEHSGRYLLKRAADSQKDQSYVLYSLTQEQLSRTMFPLGEISKEETRRIAEKNGFINAKKRDSQDICFVPNGKYAEFIEKYTGKEYPKGDFLDEQGNVLGRHKGIIRYTIGQRKGLGLSFEQPMYVTAINPKENTVTLGTNDRLYSTHVTVKEINLISVTSIAAPTRVKAKVRYRQPEQWAQAVQTDEDTLELEFEQPQRAITPGQAVVLYDGETVVGGGRAGSAR